MTAPRAAAPPPPVSRQTPAGVRILRVDTGSPAERIGLKTGDRLLKLNGHPIGDVLDYWFHCAAERLQVEWLADDTENPLPRRAAVRKPFHVKLGVELEPFEIRRCANHCVFCFVHQLPPGMRRELYIKDEDFRLSFLYGNYITGTNLTAADRKRIVEQRLSPLYFSVHATDQAVREDLLYKRGIEPIVPLLRELTEQGIYVHAQIVLCPEMNDGKVLEQTVADLAELYPMVESIAVVPLGLTDHRGRLPRLKAVDPEYARGFLPHIRRIQRATARRIGYPLVFPSDEFFLIAGLSPPGYGQYPEIPQLANGVGMYYRFYEELDELIESLPERLPRPRRVAAITTEMGAQVLGRMVEAVNRRTANGHIDLLTVTNTLFGEGITVSGLLPGKDFLAAMQRSPDFDHFLIPENALRPWDRRFLDDMTYDELVAACPGTLAAGGDTAESFVEAAYGDLFPDA